MKKVLAALALFAAPALAAIETTTITGTVYAPNGGAYPGKVTCTLSHAGTASDGTNQQVVASYYTATIGSDGALSFTLVPNDVITPAGTWYSCEYTVQPVGGRRMTWTKTYSVTTSPDPVALGAVAILDNPTLTLPTISGAANSMMATDGAGGLVSTPALQRAASGNAVRFAGRYYDYDANGDGVIDSRYCQDYDGDGTQEWSDIQSCIDKLCDSNDDLTQDGTAVDMDGDGTIGTYEKRCGTVILAPGTWTSSDPLYNIKLQWKGLTLRGSGQYNTILKTTYTRATYCASPPGSRGGLVRTWDTDGALANVTNPGTSKGADWLEIGDMTIIGMGARSDLLAAGSVAGGPTDCNQDGTADSGESTNNLLIQGVWTDVNADGTIDSYDTIDYVSLHDIRLLDCDGACNFTENANWVTAERLYAKNSGEHCYTILGHDQLWSGIIGENCGNKNWPGRGMEIYGGTGQTERVTLTDFSLSGNIGLGIITTDGQTLAAPHLLSGGLDGVTISNGFLRGNDRKDTGSLDSGYCFQTNTASTMVGKVKNIRVDNVQMTSCSGAAINLTAYDSNVSFNDVSIRAASYDNPGQVSVILNGTNISANDLSVIGADYDGNGTYESGAGVYFGTCTNCSLDGYRFTGQFYPSATFRSGVAVTELATRASVRNSEIDIDGTYNLQCIYISGSDSGEYINNKCTLDATTNAYGFIWTADAADNRFIGNRVYGGRNGFQAPAPVTLTISNVNTGTDVITQTTAAGLEVGHPLVYTSSSTTITTANTNGCVNGSWVSGSTIVYWYPITSSTGKVASSRANAIAGTLCDITGAGAGTQTFALNETGTVARFNHVETSYVGDTASYGYNNYYAPSDTDWSWNTCRSPNTANCFRFNSVSYAVGNHTFGAVGVTPSLGSTVMWVDIPGDSNWDGTVDSAMIFSGASANQKLCYEGTPIDGGVNCVGSGNPSSGTRTQTIPGATAQSGSVVLTGDANSGTVVYSDATAGTKDTGNLVCPLYGLTCVTTYTPAGVNAACTNDYNPGAATPFYSVCR